MVLPLVFPSLSETLTPLTQIPWMPFRPWKLLRPVQGPVGVEIGFGDGRFLIALAKKFPDLLWVGVEVSGYAIQHAIRKIRREKIPNVMLLKGDARLLLQLRFSSQSIQEAYINFPDPWPKKRHASRRFVSPSFFHLLISRMIPGGEIQVASDHPVVWEGMDAITQIPYLQIVPPREGPRTKYESKWLRQGKTIRKMRFRLITPPHDEDITKIPEVPMDHRVLPLEALERISQIPEGEPVYLTQGILKVLRRYWREKDGVILALIVDHTLGLRQTVWFDLHPYKENTVLLSVIQTDQTLVSPAVLEALTWLASKLEAYS